MLTFVNVYLKLQSKSCRICCSIIFSSELRHNCIRMLLQYFFQKLDSHNLLVCKICKAPVCSELHSCKPLKLKREFKICMSKENKWSLNLQSALRSLEDFLEIFTRSLYNLLPVPSRQGEVLILKVL